MKRFYRMAVMRIGVATLCAMLFLPHAAWGQAQGASVGAPWRGGLIASILGTQSGAAEGSQDGTEEGAPSAEATPPAQGSEAAANSEIAPAATADAQTPPASAPKAPACAVQGPDHVLLLEGEAEKPSLRLTTPAGYELVAFENASAALSHADFSAPVTYDWAYAYDVTITWREKGSSAEYRTRLQGTISLDVIRHPKMIAPALSAQAPRKPTSSGVTLTVRDNMNASYTQYGQYAKLILTGAQVSVDGVTWRAAKRLENAGNGTYYARVVSAAGLASDAASYVVDWVDTAPPEAEIRYQDAGYARALDVQVVIRDEASAELSAGYTGISMYTIEPPCVIVPSQAPGAFALTLDRNAAYTLWASDLAGNEASWLIEVDMIDALAPSVQWLDAQGVPIEGGEEPYEAHVGEEIAFAVTDEQADAYGNPAAARGHALAVTVTDAAGGVMPFEQIGETYRFVPGTAGEYAILAADEAGNEARRLIVAHADGARSQDASARFKQGASAEAGQGQLPVTDFSCNLGR